MKEIRGTQHIFIIGSKGLPGAYGGYETFVDKLTEYHQNEKQLKYHVACKGKKQESFLYHNAQCFRIKVPEIGSVQAIYYDLVALQYCCTYIEKNQIRRPIIYILACRIGPFLSPFRKKIHKLGGKIYVNPDGHEWMRAKWPVLVRKYWKLSERLMTKQADLMVCDSKNIEAYIRREYSRYHPKTTFIAYGAEIKKSSLLNEDKTLNDWYSKNHISSKSYYLVVGRFVPENNYEIMLREFMKSKTKRSFVLVTNVNKEFLGKLKQKTNFDKDKRIKFVGTVYDKELLMKIRENAFAYIHGHEVGGTNPSLLESLGSTDLNLLLDVGFNKEVAEDGALYWAKSLDNLKNLIERVEELKPEEIELLSETARKRIQTWYSWEYIAGQYKKIFTEVEWL